MIKSGLVRDMKSFCGGAAFITKKELMQYLGYKTPRSVEKFLNGLDRIGVTYFIPDVAENIMSEKNTREIELGRDVTKKRN